MQVTGNQLPDKIELIQLLLIGVKSKLNLLTYFK